MTEEKPISTQLDYTSYRTSHQCETPGNSNSQEQISTFHIDRKVFHETSEQELSKDNFNEEEAKIVNH